MFLLAACGGPTEPRGELVTQTLGTEFARDGADVTIPFSITNRTAGITYYVAACGDLPTVAADRLNEANWLQHTGGRCLAIYPMVPIPILPGARHEFVAGFRVGDGGTYRLRLGVSAIPNVPSDWSETSNPFDVR